MPTPSQREAIEAPLGPVLVLAGPGAGKTFCLIERTRFLVEDLRVDPDRICVFTFTNKAADEIASRLEQLGSRVELVKRGTIHSFCAELLRELGAHVGLEPGFGIADQEDQLSILSRLEGYRRWHRRVLSRFSAYRFRGDPLKPDDVVLYEGYKAFLATRNMLDFDMLVLKAAQLLADESVAAHVRQRWSAVLVDEFQDLNPSQYQIVHALAMDHKNVFAVGDDEQSIYSWTGADPSVFRDFANDFEVSTKAQLGENWRCPSQVVDLARRLVANNTPIFHDKRNAETSHQSPFEVAALTFPTEDFELRWIIADIRRDRRENNLAWGDFALLYRKHEIGDIAESGFLTAGIPCRLANKRALAEDPVVCYVIAALRVIASPHDEIHKEGFLKVVLPKTLFDSAQAKSEETKLTFLAYLEQMVRVLPKEHEDARKIWRSFYALRNLAALGARHTRIDELVEELLSQRVGEYRTRLEEHHDDLSDPGTDDDVLRLADRLTAASDSGRPLWIPRLAGVEIALKGILNGAGLRNVIVGGARPHNALTVEFPETSSLGIALGVFKAVQYMRSRSFANHFRDFTTVDLETTDRDRARAEIVEIAAVRVRDGKITDRFQSLVKPRVSISEGALKKHKLDAKALESAPFFEEVWPAFREFCGSDVCVAHNGYHFDFPILRRMSEALPGADLVTYDTLVLAHELHAGGARLEDLARVYGVDPGEAHRALGDCLTLVGVFLGLGEAKVARARKTALINVFDHLGVALALTDEATLGPEAKLLRRLSRSYALGRYSDCLEFYKAERAEAGDPTLPTVDDVIERLGGEKAMNRIRAEKTAEQRYPHAMHRLRPLLDQPAGKPLAQQLADFLERVVLSLSDRVERDPARVNLLTLHSTKGLEFSRVYIVGAEDEQLPGQRDAGKREIEEARRLLYVGMTRTKDRLVLTRVEARGGKPTGRHRFLDEMGLVPLKPEARRHV
ncbi:MAG TPA: UvrD-helicase domain-containing protein [Gemmatimonadaceae bacterium]|nr:UvrD-helicase domain-containing protein [Gemmatimonadaceae bacterium]